MGAADVVPHNPHIVEETNMRKMMCALAASCSALASCGGGGGGGGGVQSLPPPAQTVPTPLPTPTPSPTQINILPQPATQEFSVYSSGDPIRIRYDAPTNRYEVNYGGDWQTLFPHPLYYSQGSFLIGDAMEGASLGFGNSQPLGSTGAAAGYRYSSLATWTAKGDKGSGWFAFGTPTPAAAVPTSGTASYSGKVHGVTTASADGGGWGIFENPHVDGTITMQADFANGRLAGTLTAGVFCDCDSVPAIGKMNFTGDIAAATSKATGKFDTTLAGPNTFEALFTGPAAQEAIGSWAFPILNKDKIESVSGVFIAKQN